MAQLRELCVLMHAKQVINLLDGLWRLLFPVICFDIFAQARLPEIGTAMVLEKVDDVIELLLGT